LYDLSLVRDGGRGLFDIFDIFLSDVHAVLH